MRAPFAPLLPLLVLIACGGSESASTTASTPVADAGTTGDTAAVAAGPVDFTAADLDLYEKGIGKEIGIVKAAQERTSNAPTPGERAAAAQASWEEQSIPAAATAAGISEERYRLTRNAVHQVFETLDFQEKLDGPLSMDLSRASEETKARLAKDPFTALTPGAAAALRARMDRLVPVWIEYVNLTAVAG
jgi:hypothetical protein